MDSISAELVSQTGLSRVEDAQESSGAVCDMRFAMMNLPVASMAVAQQEYMDRRKQFRDWLKSVLVEGIHFGYPPFCEPKLNNEGEVGVWGKGGMKYFSKKQWQTKPSLYKPGAQLICDLLSIIPCFAPDTDAWIQRGSIPGTFIIKCQLYPRGAKHSAETLVGEGYGVRTVGDKGGDANNAMKMAEKCAMVDAVLNGYGLSDLFTQDIEDGGGGGREPEQGVNPAPRPDPKVQPRAKRDVDPEILARFNAAKQRWKEIRERDGLSVEKSEFSRMVCNVTDIDPTDTLVVSKWTMAAIEEIESYINRMEG